VGNHALGVWVVIPTFYTNVGMRLVLSISRIWTVARQVDRLDILLHYDVNVTIHTNTVSDVFAICSVRN